MTFKKSLILVMSIALINCGGSSDTEDNGSENGGGSEAIAWGYSADDGPAKWPEMYEACAGVKQSPIDITVSGDEPTVSEGFELNYTKTAFNLDQGPGKVQVNAAEGAGTMTYGGKEFTLAQWHFHTPSEHTVKGKLYDAVVHFVHLHGEGDALEAAVRGFLLDVDDSIEKSAAPFVSMVADKLAGETVSGDIDLTWLNTEEMTWWAYDGSLTTPTCNEFVNWMLYAEPIAISQAELDALQGALGNNARPPQPLNGRTVTAMKGDGV